MDMLKYNYFSVASLFWARLKERQREIEWERKRERVSGRVRERSSGRVRERSSGRERTSERDRETDRVGDWAR